MNVGKGMKIVGQKKKKRTLEETDILVYLKTVPTDRKQKGEMSVNSQQVDYRSIQSFTLSFSKNGAER